MEQPDEHLVSIFKTDDPGVLPLATMALEAEGIEYAVRSAGKSDSMQWLMSQAPTNRAVVMEIMVTSDVATKARDLVIDLERQTPGLAGVPTTDPAAIAESIDPPTVRLEEAVSGIMIGAITEAQLQELTSHLEEDADQQYFVDGPTVDLLEAAHADAALVALLRHAVGTGSGLVIRWAI